MCERCAELERQLTDAWRERDAALERIDVILPSAQRYNAQRKYAARAELLLNQLREAASAYLYSHPCPDGRKVSGPCFEEDNLRRALDACAKDPAR